MTATYQSVPMTSHGTCVSYIASTSRSSRVVDRLESHHTSDEHLQQLNSLKKQLEIELKVKTGAESILSTYTGQKKDTYRKMCDEAQLVLKDAKAKADFLRLEIKRLENGREREREGENKRVTCRMNHFRNSRSSDEFHRLIHCQ